MARPILLLLAFALALLGYSSVASAKIVEHSLHVQNLTISPLCKQQVITAANGSLPGPTIQVHEGDALIVHVFNKSPYNLTIHWHGVFQLRSGWADGPEFVTQCPIVPGNKYTYKFTIKGQEGTLWWHAHSNWLRATVHGALIIQPRKGQSYPFPKPFREFPILLGEWWNANIMDIENQALADGHGPNISEAFTINGQPSDLYNCSSSGTYKLKVVQGKIYLLRIINVALYSELFFKIANHTMTVVAVDACYTNPMVTDVIVIAPGQTIDVLLTADQPLASYYMAAHCYDSLGMEFDKTTTRGIIMYENASSSTPPMPALPAFNDTPSAFEFFSSLTSLVNGPHWAPVPLKVDEHMFVTEGLGLVPCEANNTCGAFFGLQFAASMNNESFELPTKLSMLEAFYYNVTAGIYTADFPKYPPVVFDYTNTSNFLNTALIMTPRSTKVTKLKYNSTVHIVFQNTALVGQQSHPIHLHGFNFYVLAQGFGNYDPVTGSKMFNLINPQIRNTVGVPVGGWTVIRFTANNPGEWWNANIIDVENQALADGHGPNVSDAFTINGWPGDLYNCSSTGTYKLEVVQGKKYLLRIINVALNNELFFKIANHTMTVVAVDACYTNPMVTDVIVMAPGQTIDVLLTANQQPASYYMAAHAYDSLGAEFDKTTTRGIITYGNAASSTAPMPTLPAFNDTPMAFKLYSSLTSLVNGPHWAPVPLKVDNYVFVTEGLSVVPCEANNTCGAPFGLAFAASMNNESFELPTKLSMLEAFYYNLTAGIYTADFPSYPPVAFDYTSLSNKLNVTLMMTSRLTRVT